MKKISILLAFLIVLSAFAGCAQNDSANTNADSSAVSDSSSSEQGDSQSGTESASSESTVYKANLPEGFDFEGHNFVIANNDYSIPVWSQRDIDAEELTGDAINDAVYNRNTYIEELYNCTIESMKLIDVSGTVRTFVTAGDTGLDIATIWLRNFPVLAQESMLIDLNTIEAMDLSQPWYDQNSVSDLSVLGKLFGVATDMTIMDEEATTAMVFNKQLYEDFGLSRDDKYGSIYDIVSSGNWVFDTMAEMVKGVSTDLNGDSKMDQNDQYGLLYQRDSVTGFINACDVTIASKDENDIPKITILDGIGSDVLDKIYSLLYIKNNCFHVMNYFDSIGADFTEGMVNMFANNQALFMWIRMADVENLRAVDVDFGIIPQPKWDSSQENYYSSVNPYVGTVTCIPKSTYDSEKTAMFIDAVSAESKNQLMPAYYEINLHGKVTRDEESGAMLDIIFGNRIYDIGQIYDIGDFANTLIYMTSTYDSDYASKYAKSEKMISKKLELMVSKFEELE